MGVRASIGQRICAETSARKRSGIDVVCVKVKKHKIVEGMQRMVRCENLTIHRMQQYSNPVIRETTQPTPSSPHTPCGSRRTFRRRAS